MMFGIDLGGTKAEIVALDPSGALIRRHRVPHPKGSYEVSLSTLADLVRHMENELGPATSLGICHPGAISPETGLLDGANAVWLNGQPFARDLMDRLQRPIAFANDANCLALSEATDGAGAKAEIVLAVIVGTGCGAGIAIHGRVIAGAHGMAGEICHLPLPWPNADELPGPACYCGKSGCLDAWLSGPALEADYQRLGGQKRSAHEIANSASDGDALAEQALSRLEHRMARAFAGLIQTLDPHVIVLGGGLSNIARLYERVPQLWGGFIAAERVTTSLKPTVHGDSSGVRGAAWLGRDAVAR